MRAYKFLYTGTSPTVFMNVDISRMLTIRLEGTTTLRAQELTLPLTKNGQFGCRNC